MRPYRASLSAEDAARNLRADVTAGRLDHDTVNAVLAAAGHRVPRRREAIRADPAAKTRRSR